MSPISPIDSFKAFCIDLASVNGCAQISGSLQAHETWQPTTQKALSASLIASRIDNHEYDNGSSSIDMHDLYILQYNIRTFTKESDRKVFFLDSQKKELPSLHSRKQENPAPGSL